MGRPPVSEGHSQNNSKQPRKQGAYKSESGKRLNYGALTAFDQEEVKKRKAKKQKKQKLDMKDAQDEV